MFDISLLIMQKTWVMHSSAYNTAFHYSIFLDGNIRKYILICKSLTIAVNW